MSDIDFIHIFDQPVKQDLKKEPEFGKNLFEGFWNTNQLQFDKKPKGKELDGTELKIFEESEKVEVPQIDIFVEIERYKKNRDAQAFNNIMTYLEPTVNQAIKVFGQGNEALRGQAKLIIIDALDSYDPKKGDLKIHVLLHLQRLRRLSGQTAPVPIPETVKLTLMQIQQAEKELQDKYGRPPSDQEIADYTGLSIKKIQKAREYMQGIAESNVEGIEAVTERQKELEQDRRELWIQAIYTELPPLEQYILDCAYGRNGRKKKTLQEIANDLKLPVSTVHAKLKKIEEMISLGEQI